MGFDAIWISPVSANVEGNTTAGEAFHGVRYWYQDITKLNPHFGSPDDLKALSQALHKRGMYLMLDVVVNHMAAPKMPPDFNFKDFFHPFTDETYFHQPPCFTNENTTDANTLEQCWLGDPQLPLPDLNTEDRGSWTFCRTPKDFWPAWASAAGVFTMGEVISTEPNFAAPYTEVLDAILDYPTYFPMVSAFSSPQGQFAPFIAAVTASQKSYKNGLFLTGSFFENHDQPRFQSYTTDPALVRNGVTFPFVHDGIPIVYYGQEQGYQGAADPMNREALWFAAYQQEKPLVGHFKVMNAARRAAAASTTDNFLHTPMKFLAIEDNSFAVSKPPMLALFTNIGSETSRTITWNVKEAGFSPHEDLVDVLTCSKVQADEKGGVKILSMYGMPQVLMPASTMTPGGDLCPGVATGRREKSMAPSNDRFISGALMFGSALFFILRFWPIPGAKEYYPLNDPAIGTALPGLGVGTNEVPPLFKPLTIRNETFKNRIFVSPMCQYSSDNGHATDWHFVHIGGLATRGAGGIVMEATSVVPEGRISPEDAGLWTDSQMAPLKRIVHFAHAQGTKIGVQLGHAGRKASTLAPWVHANYSRTHVADTMIAQESEGGWPNNVYAPSDISYHDGTYPKPRAMTLDDLKRVEDAFVAAIGRCKEIGFDLIEIHGAHGYLLHTFLSPLSNVRADEYGGQPLENRMRYPLQIAKACRAAWDKPLFFRISASDWAEFPEKDDNGQWKQWGIEQSKIFVGELQKIGIDLIDTSSGGLWAQQKIPLVPGYQVPFAEQIKKAYGSIGVGAVGLIDSPKQANEIIKSGQADVVFLARALIRNPHWPIHAGQELNVAVKPADQYERGFTSMFTGKK
ncbi:hypothetical protein EWM64_g219 [Hericium alpestre]|uniref:alpha-galactosidase n=1 Tax=Hericium alpestre TaxID=135208 RepID=A0A4Z0A9K8_9AGAM|nr:hypothetical protein EWM64_g219 [Hericium alpestre]